MGEANAPLAAMTFNERLFARGLFDRFDAARAGRDRDALRSILTEIEIFDVEGAIDGLLDRPPSTDRKYSAPRQARGDPEMIGRIFAADRLIADDARVGDGKGGGFDKDMVDHPRLVSARGVQRCRRGAGRQR